MDIYDQVEASLVVTRCLDRAGFSDLDLLGPAPPPPPPPPAPAPHSMNFTKINRYLQYNEFNAGLL